MLEMLVRAKSPGGAMQVQRRWCVVTSLGFQMFAPNRIPEEGEAPDLAIVWSEMVDARPDAAPRGYSGDASRLCFRITFERAGSDAQTLLLIEREQQRLNQWIVCLREGMEQFWRGAPRTGAHRAVNERSGTSKSKRALSSMVKKTETWWTSIAQRIDTAVEEVYKSMDFSDRKPMQEHGIYGPKEDVQSEFEDAASESDDLSIRSEDSDGDVAAESHNSRWTGHELKCRDRYLKEDQDLLDLLFAADVVKEAVPAVATRATPQRSDSETPSAIKRVESSSAAAGKSGAAQDVGAKGTVWASKRKGGSEVGGIRGLRRSRRNMHHPHSKGRACDSQSEIDVGARGAAEREDDEMWGSADDDEHMSESTKHSAHPSTKLSSTAASDENL